MIERLRGRLSYANVMATVAVFLALGGGVAWALANNSVKSRHIDNGHVRTNDLADNAVNSAKLGDDSVALRHLQGTTSTVASNFDFAANACGTIDLPATTPQSDDGVLVVPRRRDGADPGWDPRLILDGYSPKAPAALETGMGMPGFTVRICNISNDAVEDARLSFYVVALG